MHRPVSNPPNPWLSRHVEWLDEPPQAELVVYEEEAKSVLAANDSPDVGFRWSVNPYRGCQHACAYCYARPSHQYLGFGAGTDFDRRIVVKVNAPEVLARELARRSWKRETVVFSGNTDCYQPLEASYELTRRCLEVCVARANPIGMITKGALVRRDIDLLARLARGPGAHVFVSIPFLDDEVGRKLEPGAAAPNKRFEALRALSDAGITTGIAIAPVIPGLNEADIPRLLERARDCGAISAFMTLLRLPAEVLPVFQERVEQVLPERARKIESAIRDMRAGAMNQSAFGARMSGSGPRWNAVEQLFEIHRKRYGMNVADTRMRGPELQRPSQGQLFS
ncbi:MAG: PA0069 family radical SAM protein [Planctomycetes bacterium]|nr:PA0069 family radical SAM protein [Planctomycetota bacterium]